MIDAYRDDLAHIHDVGYTHVAEAASGVLLEELRRAGLTRGRIVDVGCGGGILSARLAAAGYDVLGLDISPAMIELARQRVPEAEFRVDSWVTAEVPPCIAVAAIGEVFNYRFDKHAGPASIRQWLERVHAALEPGGLLLFDVAGPGRVPGGGMRTWAAGDDWAVLIDAREDTTLDLVTRSITTFRRAGDHYRRDHETHHLRLYAREEVEMWLAGTGFAVQTRGGYAPVRPLPGSSVFAAMKET